MSDTLRVLDFITFLHLGIFERAVNFEFFNRQVIDLRHFRRCARRLLADGAADGVQSEMCRPGMPEAAKSCARIMPSLKRGARRMPLGVRSRISSAEMTRAILHWLASPRDSRNPAASAESGPSAVSPRRT